MSETVEARYCPGWTPDPTGSGSHASVICGGRNGARNLLAKTVTSKSEVIDGRNVVTSMEPTFPPMCPRCVKQKAKYDKEQNARDHARDNLERDQRDRLALYTADLRAAVTPKPSLLVVVDAIERITFRLRRRPFRNYAEAKAHAEANNGIIPDEWEYGMRGSGGSGGRVRLIEDSERWAVLRLFVGLDGEQ